MRIEYGNNKKFVDYLFWITLILFTNPGGILQAFGEDSGDGGINFTDILFFILVICSLMILKKKYFFGDKVFFKILKFLFIFLIYYVVIFGFFIPQFKNSYDYSVFKTIIKIRHGIINFFLFQFVYMFFLRSYKFFFKIFIISSIIILALFFFSMISGVEVLPLKTLDRRFVSISRVFMYSYGLMPLLISMGAVLLIFNFKFKYSSLILLGFILMFLTWVLSLLRREIFGTILLFILTAIISNYLYRKNLVPVKKTLLILFQLTIIFFIVKISFPNYLKAVESSVEQTVHVIKYGETLSGQKDVRLGFGKKELKEKIINNYIVGTGFDNNWRVSEEAGYEASDYPFLAAIAMVGILGLVIFFPIYIILYKTIFKDLIFLRSKPIVLDSFEYYVLIFLIVYFVFEVLNYTYWFLPVSLFTHSDHHKWYIFLAMFLAARRIFYFNDNKFKNCKPYGK